MVEWSLPASVLQRIYGLWQREKACIERNEDHNKIVQKYGEIYSYQARRQIVEDEGEEREVINMREKRVKKCQEKEEASQQVRVLAKAKKE